MSLSYSISNAMTGLTATSRAAELVSNNVANAMTEGYARRELELSARNFGGRGAGVTVDGVKRVVDEAVLRDRRLADASVGKSSTTAEFYGALERLIGTPEDYSSLTGRVDKLEQSLIEAASRPDNDARLQTVVDAAGALARHLNEASDGLQRLRMDAEDGIAKHVDTLNASLKQIAELNLQIVSATQSKRDPSALMDLRQQEIDEISSIVSLRVMPRDNGQVAVFTTQGARLVDGRPSVLSFEQTPFISPEKRAPADPLKGIFIDGKAENIASFSGGALGALFEVRDQLAVDAQDQIDAVARDLIERFEGDTVDPARAPTDPGMFVDPVELAGNPREDLGLAARISINTDLADIWKLRDGLGAAVEGNVGDSTLLKAMADALATKRPGGAGAIASNRDAGEIASYVLSGIGVQRQATETALVGATSQQNALQDMQAADGVDTDAEMQKLMLIEQTYAANARVISVVDDLMQILLGL